jgi:hypothetical protein
MNDPLAAIIARHQQRFECTEVTTCRGCYCDDNRACAGGCSWVLLDVGSPTGVCSTCADLVHWHVVAMATMGLEP